MLPAIHKYQHSEKDNLFKYDFLLYSEPFETCLTSADVRFSMNVASESSFPDLRLENEKALRVPLGCSERAHKVLFPKNPIDI